MKYKIDIYKLRDSNITIEGWVLPRDLKSKPNFYVYDKDNNSIIPNIVYTKRSDVADKYLKNSKIADDTFGFDISFPYVPGEIYKFIIECENDKISQNISDVEIMKLNSFEYRKNKKLLEYIKPRKLLSAIEFLFTEGPSSFIKKVKSKMKGSDVEYDYEEWYKLTKITQEELDSQRKYIKTNYQKDKIPYFSVVVPAYNTSKEFLDKLVNSFLDQTFSDFELIIADASENPLKLSTSDSRVKLIKLDKNLGIAQNTNEAIKNAIGKYIVLADHDDELELFALYELYKVFSTNSKVQMVYSDEDKIDMSSKVVFEPHFKPDFNLDLLLSVNYFCHLFAAKKDFLYSICDKEYEFERAEYDGAQDYDLFLRLTNKLINEYYDTKADGTLDNYLYERIYHIRKVLYHWRCHRNSTAKDPKSKEYAFNSGARALEYFYNNTKLNFLKVEKVVRGIDYGFYRPIFVKDEEPLISIIIPNKDHIEDLDKCIKSLSKSSYKNIEIIVVENNSTDEKTFAYYENNKDKFKTVYYKGSFNFSKINNFAVGHARGEYLFFLNNDTEMIDPDSIFNLYAYVRRDDVGIAGCKLLYSDDTIQHAGVVLGFGGIAGHTFIGVYDKDISYMHRASCIQDMTAVTAAAMMVKKSVFEKIKGFDEEFVVAFNDIDLCMRVRKLGYLVVYNPYAKFYHYESKSRGLEDTKEKVERFNNETALFNYMWEQEMQDGDRYYNPNLTLRKSNFALRDLHFEEIGAPYKLPDEIIEKVRRLKDEGHPSNNSSI